MTLLTANNQKNHSFQVHSQLPNPEILRQPVKDNLNEQMEVIITFLCEYKP